MLKNCAFAIGSELKQADQNPSQVKDGLSCHSDNQYDCPENDPLCHVNRLLTDVAGDTKEDLSVLLLHHSLITLNLYWKPAKIRSASEGIAAVLQSKRYPESQTLQTNMCDTNWPVVVEKFK